MYVGQMARYYGLPRADFAKCVFRGGVPVYYQSYVFKTYENHSYSWRNYTENWDIYDWKRVLERAEGDLL
jgi:hypothetical protein